MSTPRIMRLRASSPKRTSLAAMRMGVPDQMRDATWRQGTSGGLLGRHTGVEEHAHQVGLLHDQQFLAIDLDLGAGPLAEQHAVTGLHVERNQLAAVVARTGAGGDDL